MYSCKVCSSIGVDVCWVWAHCRNRLHFLASFGHYIRPHAFNVHVWFWLSKISDETARNLFYIVLKMSFFTKNNIFSIEIFEAMIWDRTCEVCLQEGLAVNQKMQKRLCITKSCVEIVDHTEECNRANEIPRETCTCYLRSSHNSLYFHF